MQSQPHLQKMVSGGPQQSFFIFSSPTMLDAWKEVGSWTSSGSLPAKTRLFLQGAWPQAVYLIDRGLVKLLAMDSEGQEVFIGIYSQGFLLGANAALLQRPLGATAETITPCQVYYMSVEDFRYWAKTSSPFSWQLGQLQSVRMYKLIAQRVSLRWMTARQRLEQFIWELMATQEPGRSVNHVRFQMPLKMEELAQMIAISRQHLTRLLHELERDGILRRDKGWFIIPEPQRLWHWTDY